MFRLPPQAVDLDGAESTPAGCVNIPAPSQLGVARWLTPEQVAELLQVPVREVRRLLNAGGLDYLRLGRFTRIHQSDLEDLLRRRVVRGRSNREAKGQT